MKQIEENVINSFRLAKTDIIELHNNMVELSQSQEKIMEVIEGMRSREAQLTEMIKELNERLAEKKQTIVERVKVVSKRTNKDYVASKTGNKFHITECPFAKNIKPKMKVRFKSRIKAFNQGYKPCNCVR